MAAAQYREAGWTAICRAAARVWRCGSGRLGIHSGARGGHPVAQRSREGAAMAGVGHGAGAARPCVASRWGKKERQGEEIRSDRWGPRGRESMSGRWAGGFGGLKGVDGLAVW
jgi:hypothetical protein